MVVGRENEYVAFNHLFAGGAQTRENNETRAFGSQRISNINCLNNSSNERASERAMWKVPVNAIEQRRFYTFDDFVEAQSHSSSFFFSFVNRIAFELWTNNNRGICEPSAKLSNFWTRNLSHLQTNWWRILHFEGRWKFTKIIRIGIRSIFFNYQNLWFSSLWQLSSQCCTVLI